MHRDLPDPFPLGVSPVVYTHTRTHTHTHTHTRSKRRLLDMDIIFNCNVYWNSSIICSYVFALYVLALYVLYVLE
jgi:hypothetical protein